MHGQQPPVEQLVALRLAALSAPAQAQPYHGDRDYRPYVVVVPPPPPRHIERHGYYPRQDHRAEYYRHDHRAYYRNVRMDSDRDDVPDRYDATTTAQTIRTVAERQRFRAVPPRQIGTPAVR